ncbi:hypothetical protein NC651_012457 [Populus alba x Populus x berolinensis]|nr:hypothetical protein NC651_012457 [Populus alba x Populus x berolinensis]
MSCLATECFATGGITEKFDAFSFGRFLLQVLTSNFERRDIEEQQLQAIAKLALSCMSEVLLETISL